MSEFVHDTRQRPERAGLGTMNALFHEGYERLLDDARGGIERGETPVVVRLDDRLIVVDGEQRTEHEVTGERYHELKAMSHVPLAVYLWLAEGRAGDHRLRQALTDCAAIGEPAAGLAEACQALADQYDRDGLLGHQAVQAFSRSVGPLFDRLVTEATEEEVAALAKVMRRIEDELGEARWAQTFLVVCAGHQPRYKQLTKLFFERWLNARPGATADTRHRVLYAEARNSVDEALDLVATRIVNGRLAEAFLNSPLSMDQDVLGDAGIVELDRFFAP